MPPVERPLREVQAGIADFRFGDTARLIETVRSEGRRAFAAALLVSLPWCGLALTAMSLPGCRLGGADLDPLSQGQLVFGGKPAATTERTSSDVYADAERALASAESAWRSGDPLTALALANQALREGVPAELEGRFRDLRVRARAAVVTDKIVKLRAVPLKDVVADGDPLPLRILIRNLSAADLRSPLREGGSSDALFVLQVSREDRDVWGNVRTSEFTMRAPLVADLAIPPGGEREVQVTIGPDLVALRHGGFSVFRVGGVFRPVAVRVGESEFFDALPIEPALVRVFQRGYEPMAADPLSSLRSAVAKRSPPHVLVAAELLAPAERAEGRAVLSGALERDPPLEFVLRTALARLDELDLPAGSAAAAALPAGGPRQ